MRPAWLTCPRRFKTSRPIDRSGAGATNIRAGVDSIFWGQRAWGNAAEHADVTVTTWQPFYGPSWTSRFVFAMLKGTSGDLRGERKARGDCDAFTCAHRRTAHRAV